MTAMGALKWYHILTGLTCIGGAAGLVAALIAVAIAAARRR